MTTLRFSSVLAILFSVLLVTSHAQPASPPAQPSALPESEQDLANLTVWGNGEVMVDAVLSQIQVSVEVRSELLGSDSGDSETKYPDQNWQSANSVQETVAERTQTLLKYLRSQEHVKQLKTVSLSLRPLERWKDGELFNYGWVGVHTLSFEVEDEYAGQYIDGSIEHGASRIDSITMKARDEDRTSARHKAIKQASQGALAEASVLLESLGLDRSSLQIVDVQIDSGANVPFYAYDLAMPMAAASAEARSGGATQIVGGQQAVSARVMYKFSFKQGELKAQAD